LVDEDKDHARAEEVSRELLTLDPGDAEARHNLSLLLRRHSPAHNGTATA
jgi:hypothetical protein